MRLIASAQSGTVQVCVEGAGSTGWTCHTPGQDLSIDFGMLQLSAPAAQRRVEVRNGGVLDLRYFGTALSATTSSEFAIAPDQTQPAGGTAIAPGAKAGYVISYKPVDGGSDTGTATVTTSDGTSPEVRIQLRGGGVAPRLCVRPAPTLDFGAVQVGSSSTLPVELTSRGPSHGAPSGPHLLGDIRSLSE